MNDRVCDERHSVVDHRLAEIESTLYRNGLVSKTNLLLERTADLPVIRRMMYVGFGVMTALQVLVGWWVKLGQ